MSVFNQTMCSGRLIYEVMCERLTEEHNRTHDLREKRSVINVDFL